MEPINQVQTDSTIGIKKLSAADLGTSSTSKLTHIGLFENTLNFLSLESQTVPSQLIYANRTIDLLALLDPISNKDGSPRSPKIRLGHESKLNLNGLRINSVVREVREIARTIENQDWFLLWFGLDTNELIFFLFNESSTEFREVQHIVGNIGQRKQISSDSSQFQNLINYLNEKVENVNLEYYEELEIASQTGAKETSKRKIPRVRDIEKANELFKQTGRRGEELLYQYLDSQRTNGLIKDFKWLNQSIESGMPYDFEITNDNGVTLFSDAKATTYKFEQPIILSSGELKFIHENKDYYLIHRLYHVNNTPSLRICRNISAISDLFIPNYNVFNEALLNENLFIRSLNIAVRTDLDILTFGNEIQLPQS